jgi:hypothetical protein
MIDSRDGLQCNAMAFRHHHRIDVRHTHICTVVTLRKQRINSCYLRTLACMQIDQGLASSVGVYNTTVCMVAVRCRDGINPSFNLLIDSRQACVVGSKISGRHIYL